MCFAKVLGSLLVLTTALCAGQYADSAGVPTDATPTDVQSIFRGSQAGDEREVAGIKLCWCPPGRFIMGSPHSEPERRPGEDQVEVTLSKGYWMAKYESTQGQWKQIMGDLPGALTDQLPAGD